MKIERFDSNGRFHTAIKYNGVLYLSGAVGPNSDTVKGQAQETLDNLDALLKKYGSDKRHILSACVYLKDIASFNEFNSVWDAWVESGYEPTRTCVEAKLASPAMLVEVTLTAALCE